MCRADAGSDSLSDVPTRLVPNVAALDELLKRLDLYGYSGTVLVAQEGQILLHAAYGFADDVTGERNRVGTRFRTASMAKTITAAAILLLLEDQKLQLDDPVGRFFEFAPEDKRHLAISDLLTHTAGLADWPGASARFDMETNARGLLAMPLAHTDHAHHYSNPGYGLLAAIVEKVAGAEFHDFVRNRIFDPAGMVDTAFVWETERLAGAPVAAGKGSPSRAYAVAPQAPWSARGSTGVISTALDLHRFNEAVRSDLFEPATRDLFLQPIVDIVDSTYFKYGYGWRHMRDDAGEEVVISSGNESDFSGMLVNYRSDVTVVALWNQSLDHALFRDLFFPLTRSGPGGVIAGALFGDAGDLPPAGATTADAEFARFAGTFGDGDGAAVSIRHGPTGLHISAASQSAVCLVFPGLETDPAELESRRDELELQLAPAADFNRRAHAIHIAGPIDPLDMFGAGPNTVLERWSAYEQAHGPIRHIRVTSAVTHERVNPEGSWSGALELAFDGFRIEERYIRFGHDEAFILPGAPAASQVRLVAAGEEKLYGHDLLGRGTITLRFEDGGVEIADPETGEVRWRGERLA